MNLAEQIIYTETLNFNVESSDKIITRTITGAQVGDNVLVSLATNQTDFSIRGYVSATDTVTIIFSFEETEDNDTIELNSVPMVVRVIQ